MLCSAPVVDDVEHLGADNSAENDENSKIPGIVAVIAQPLGVANADPKADQDAHGHQESIGRQEKLSDMKELWEHWLVRCSEAWIRYAISLAGRQAIGR